MTNHEQKALDIIEDEEFTATFNGRRDGSLLIGEAQVRATLHLAEQQRVANLIAYYSLAFNQEVHGIVPSQQTRKRCYDASNQIIEGLGL